jgi:hypothetical protein
MISFSCAFASRGGTKDGNTRELVLKFEVIATSEL